MTETLALSNWSPSHTSNAKSTSHGTDVTYKTHSS